MSYDCIKTTTTSTGSGAISVAPGTLLGFRPFSDLTPGDVRAIRISDAAGNWELVEATVTGNLTFTRDRVITGSNGTSPISWAAGEKSVEVVISSDEFEAVRGMAADALEVAEQAAQQTAQPGDDGLSAYQLAVAGGFVGTQSAWLQSLKGEPGDDGLSAYQVAVAAGFFGNQADWLLSLKGSAGDPGQSAYQTAVANGFVGTQSAWLASLQGAPGSPGTGGGASTQDVAFTTTIPFTFNGTAIMAPQTVAAKYTFTAAANPVKMAQVYMRLTANGNAAHVPDFPGQKEMGGSMQWDNRAGIVNHIWLWWDGVDYKYTTAQDLNAVAADITAPTQSSAAVANATPTIVTITFSEALDPAFVPAASTMTVGGHTVTGVAVSGATANLTVNAFVNGEAARAASYSQPATNGLRDMAGNLVASFTGLTITNNVAAVDNTAPAFVSAQVANGSPSVVQITMSETLAASTPAAGAFALSHGKTPVSVAVSGLIANVTANSAYTSADTNVQVTYTMPGANPRLQDAAGNATDSFGPSAVTNNVAQAGDTTAPALSSPTATKTGSTTATGTVSTANDAAGTLYYRASANSTESVAFVKAGANQPVTATGVQNVTFNALPAASTLYAHYVHTDPSGNDSNVASSGSFVTDAAAPAPVSTRFGGLIAMTESASEPWTYTSTGPSISANPAGGIALLALQSGVDGSLQVTVTNGAGSPGLGITSSATPVGYNTLPCFLYANTTYTAFTSGTNHSASVLNTVTRANGDIMRVRRTGTTVVGEVSKDSGATWTPIYQWTGVSATVNKFQGLVPGAVGLSVLTNPAGLGLA